MNSALKASSLLDPLQQRDPRQGTPATLPGPAQRERQPLELQTLDPAPARNRSRTARAAATRLAITPRKRPARTAHPTPPAAGAAADPRTHTAPRRAPGAHRANAPPAKRKQPRPRKKGDPAPARAQKPTIQRHHERDRDDHQGEEQRPCRLIPQHSPLRTRQGTRFLKQRVLRHGSAKKPEARKQRNTVPHSDDHPDRWPHRRRATSRPTPPEASTTATARRGRPPGFPMGARQDGEHERDRAEHNGGSREYPGP